ncbi:hypothetical protein NA57DRAFT_59239 [Rhizodiscina lignyota]|uniref:Uncharacterized protein n=1 Tax=Rhizodiscina lignyota TaxID=1504668 RepID=A0A9P4ICT7_9PEZI|nr:hypothetical protein NA57DRAFT_59239 [Rhizodiscina lignyota]
MGVRSHKSRNNGDREDDAAEREPDNEESPGSPSRPGRRTTKKADDHASRVQKPKEKYVKDGELHPQCRQPRIKNPDRTNDIYCQVHYDRRQEEAKEQKAAKEEKKLKEMKKESAKSNKKTRQKGKRTIKPEYTENRTNKEDDEIEEEKEGKKRTRSPTEKHQKRARGN